MNPNFQYAVDNALLIAMALGNLATVIFTGWIKLTQAKNTRTMNQTHVAAQEIQHDLRNGVGEKIAASAAAHLEVAATAAADKIVQRADEVAATLEAAKWDGTERRGGPPDRRQP